MDAFEVISRELNEGEKILWSGQPHLKRLSKTYIIILLLWIAVMVFWAAVALTTLIFVLFLAPFAPMGIYMVLRRFKMKNTYYAITDKRVLKVFAVKRKKIESAGLCDLECDHVSPGYAGIGTIIFGSKPPLYQNSVLAFSYILNAEKVYKIYKDAKLDSGNS